MTLFQQILSFVVFTAGLGYAMTEALGDPAVGFAIGVAGAAAFARASRRGRCGRGQAQ